MKKYLISFFIFVLIGCYSCQEQNAPKQYFEESAEIEVVKKLTEAFLNQDWETYRSCYSDTAKVWENVWWNSDPGMSIDESIEFTKSFTSSLVKYTFEDITYEMIIKNNGDVWVSFWAKWRGQFTEDGKDVNLAVHNALCFVDTKIVYELGFWDNLPIYLAQQALLSKEQ